jgi:hypothetical protein
MEEDEVGSIFSSQGALLFVCGFMGIYTPWSEGFRVGYSTDSNYHLSAKLYQFI